MNLPQNTINKINDLGKSLEFKKIKVFPKTVETSGKKRIFTIPNEYTKNKQKELYGLISKANIPQYVFSQKGYFFADKARYHLHDKYLVNIDIKNFYPSIHFKTIAKIYSDLKIQRDQILRLTFLTTFNQSLPLGFVTSPFLSNLIMNKIDSDIFNYSRRRRIKYSRYFDDITFSNNQGIPELFLKKIEKILKAKGFKINTNKTEFFGSSDIKKVLGLRLEENDVNITQEYLDKVITDIEDLGILINNGSDYKDFKLQVQGEVNFIRQIKLPTYINLTNKYPFLK